MVEKVLLAEPRGFCAGVEMAIKALTWMVNIFEAPVYCYHEIVHNQAVVDAFENAGVVFVDDISEVPEGRPVMLSAHGSAPEIVTEATNRAAVMVDAVCPLVTKVHHEVKLMASKDFDIIYVGHDGHDEAIGAVAEAPASVTLVDPAQGLGSFSAKDPSKVALLAQTTLGMHEWEGVLDDAAALYPELTTARRSDLCYATTNRQTAIRQLANETDTILVVGSETSSNTQALVRVGNKEGTPSYRVDGPDDIDPSWLIDQKVVGVTAGASAPDQRVREVIAAVAPRNGVTILSLTDEDEYFPLPPSLRRFVKTLQAVVEAGFAVRHQGLPGPIEQDPDYSATGALDLLGV
ncbi:MAG: 4-hydroxy-3-methylbut-2-enyl diphosphate reductase [Acidimicrobiia bacterium]|nr:4-hydroxy-3-methylbut-2-enyl diphosphate reductase [Acidimicrobiia bacterium]